MCLVSPPADDDGISLVELMVSMSLMSLSVAIFTGGFVQMYRATNSSDAQTTAQQQLSTAFLRLDRDVPYASAVSVPGTSGNDWYVEYLIDSGGTPTCAELRLRVASAQLQRRTWANGTTAAPGPWAVVASGVQAAAASGPFTLLPADSVLNYPRLQVVLAATAGGGGTIANRQIKASWAAVNAVQATDTICASKRSVP